MTTFNAAQPADPMRISFNLDQVSGVGDLSGLTYIGTGINRINLPTLPSDPINVSFELRALTQPNDPMTPNDPILPLDVSFLLTFDTGTGALLNVNILSMSVPIPE